MAFSVLGGLTFLVFLHVLGAALWVGGALALVVANRVLKRELPDAERARLVGAIGRRATPILVTGFVVAVISGALLLFAKLGGYSALERPGFWETRVGTLVLWKSIVVAMSAAAAAAHGVLAARGRLKGRAAALLGSATGLLGVALLYLGAAMRWT